MLPITPVLSPRRSRAPPHVALQATDTFESLCHTVAAVASAPEGATALCAAGAPLIVTRLTRSLVAIDGIPSGAMEDTPTATGGAAAEGSAALSLCTVIRALATDAACKEVGAALGWSGADGFELSFSSCMRAHSLVPVSFYGQDTPNIEGMAREGCMVIEWPLWRLHALPATEQRATYHVNALRAHPARVIERKPQTVLFPVFRGRRPSSPAALLRPLLTYSVLRAPSASSRHSASPSPSSLGPRAACVRPPPPRQPLPPPGVPSRGPASAGSCAPYWRPHWWVSRQWAGARTRP